MDEEFDPEVYNSRVCMYFSLLIFCNNFRNEHAMYLNTFLGAGNFKIQISKSSNYQGRRVEVSI